MSSDTDRDKPAQRPIFIKAQLGLGQTLTADGHASEALPLLEKSVDMAVTKFGPDRFCRRRAPRDYTALGRPADVRHYRRWPIRNARVRTEDHA